MKYAFKNRAEGSIGVKASSDGGMASIIIRNDGPGIPALLCAAPLSG